MSLRAHRAAAVGDVVIRRAPLASLPQRLRRAKKAIDSGDLIRGRRAA